MFIFFLLGTWQLFKLKYKNNIIKNMNLSAVHLLDNNHLEKFNYRYIKIDGILTDIEIYVFAGKNGYYLLSPMLMNNGNYILVNKKIVKKINENNSSNKIEKITASGFLYCNSNKIEEVWFIKNDIALNTWFTLNTKKISKDLGIKLENCLVLKNNFTNDLVKKQYNKHLEYSITWFMFSLICLIYIYK